MRQRRERDDGRRGRGRGRRDDRRGRPERGRRDNPAPREIAWEWPQQVRVSGSGPQGVDDGVEMRFILPLPASARAEAAALLMVSRLGLREPVILNAESAGRFVSAFTISARCDLEVNLPDEETAEAALPAPAPDFASVNRKLREHFDRKPLVVGACLGSDAYNFSIDTLFNPKGYLGHPGLERYPTLHAVNLRSQNDIADLLRRVAEMQADAVIVTASAAGDDPLSPFRTFAETLRSASSLNPRLIKIACGPRLSPEAARELGYDHGFGPATPPIQIAHYLASELISRQSASPTLEFAV